MSKNVLKNKRDLKLQQNGCHVLVLSYLIFKKHVKNNYCDNNCDQFRIIHKR